MKREMAILAQLTGVDDKLKLAILEATDEQQGKMIASLKERRAPFQWDEGGVDPFAVAAEQKRDRAIGVLLFISTDSPLSLYSMSARERDGYHCYIFPIHPTLSLNGRVGGFIPQFSDKDTIHP